MQVKVKKLHPDAIMPKYATDGSACFDLHVCDEGMGTTLLSDPGVVAYTFRTGLAFDIPQGHVMLVFSRSGHGFKNGVRLANCVGVIDSDYRGEVCVRLAADHDNNSLLVLDGDRIAQAMIIPIPSVELVEADSLTDTERGAGGFGSTGV